MIHYVYDAVHRIEAAQPQPSDLARGVAAEVADAVWLLGRQWQLGEMQGEDASSPVRVSFTRIETPVEMVGAAGERDTGRVPPQALVESEPEEWWTVGRRVRLGRRLLEHTELPDDDALRLADLPHPYHVLNGEGYDGRELWRHRAALGLEESWFVPQPPAEPKDLWDSRELVYHADFTAGNSTLRLRRHEGGELDWFSVDAEGEVPGTDGKELDTLCSRLRYPGAPTPRWWEIEDATLDIGGQAPDRAHFATLLLIDLLASHSDDWFTFPVDTRPGVVLTLRDVRVTDSFGDVWDLTPPREDWSLFAVRGLDRESLVVWPTVASPLAGPLLDEVILGVDEEAGHLWAVERRIAARDIATDPIEEEVPERVDTGARRHFCYIPAGALPSHWHPYVIEDEGDRRRFVQGRLADLSGAEVTYAPVPRIDLLYDRQRRDGDPVHQIEPSAVSRNGLKLERRYMLGRRADGTPLLWSQRCRTPLAALPALPLHFDTLESVVRAAE